MTTLQLEIIIPVFFGIRWINLPVCIHGLAACVLKNVSFRLLSVPLLREPRLVLFCPVCECGCTAERTLGSPLLSASTAHLRWVKQLPFLTLWWMGTPVLEDVPRLKSCRFLLLWKEVVVLKNGKSDLKRNKWDRSPRVCAPFHSWGFGRVSFPLLNTVTLLPVIY